MKLRTGSVISLVVFICTSAPLFIHADVVLGSTTTPYTLPVAENVNGWNGPANFQLFAVATGLVGTTTIPKLHVEGNGLGAIAVLWECSKNGQTWRNCSASGNVYGTDYNLGQYMDFPTTTVVFDAPITSWAFVPNSIYFNPSYFYRFSLAHVPHYDYASDTATSTTIFGDQNGTPYISLPGANYAYILPTVADLFQYRQDGTTAIPAGGGFIGNSVVLKADVSDQDNAAAVLEVEVKPAGQAFDGTNTTFSATTTSTVAPLATTTVSVTVDHLITPQGNVPADGINQSFHWRVRAIDSEGNTSDWVTYGPDQNGTDFTATYTLGQAAADLAKGVVTYSYTPGAKGWDVTSKRYVENADIKNGYYAITSKSKVPGTDCSGLIMWTYNKSFDATKPFKDNFITDELARDQYADRQPITESELQPGDQLFFDFDGDGIVDHVVEYVGGDKNADLVSARDEHYGIISASERVYSHLTGQFMGFGRPQHRDITMAVTAHSPVHLVVTDPNGNTIDNSTIASSSTEIIRALGDLRYTTVDIDANGYPEDMVYSHNLKQGTYHIVATPMPNTVPDQTYSLDFTAGSTTVSLAHNVPLSQIPTTGYGVVVGQDNSVTLDNMPPEAHIGFSTSTKKILTTGSDDASTTTVAIYATSTVVTDAAGNTLSLNLSKNLAQSNYAAMVIPSFTYSSGTTTTATTSLRYFWLTDKTGKFTLLISAIKTPTDRLISLYVPLLNKTYVLASTPSDDTADLSTQTTLLLLRKKLNTYTGMFLPHVSTKAGSVVVEY